MTDRSEAQAGVVDGLAAKQDVANSITPTNLSTDQFQYLLDRIPMRDEYRSVRREIDSFTINPIDVKIDVYPDGGAAADVDATLQVPANYPEGFSCLIINDTDASSGEPRIVRIKDDGGATVKEIRPNESYHVFYNSTDTQWETATGNAENPLPLPVATYGDFNAVANATLPTGRYIITGNGNQFSNFPDEWNPLQATTPYIVFKNVVNESTIYTEDIDLYSAFDTTNDSIGRISRRGGGNFGGATTQPWHPVALTTDITVTEVVGDTQSFQDQLPTATDTPTLIRFSDTGAVNPGGSIEILADEGTHKFNQIGTYHITQSAQFGRSTSPGIAHLLLYSAFNVTTDATVAVDSDYFPAGRHFSNILDDANTVIGLEYTNLFFNVPSLPFSYRVFQMRLSEGTNDGGLYSFDLSAYNHFGNPFANNASSAVGTSLFELKDVTEV